jgi:hypothetical protein
MRNGFVSGAACTSAPALSMKPRLDGADTDALVRSQHKHPRSAGGAHFRHIVSP